jgi:hypothetical protein
MNVRRAAWHGHLACVFDQRAVSPFHEFHRRAVAFAPNDDILRLEGRAWKARSRDMLPLRYGSRSSKFSDDMPLALLTPKPDILIMTQKEFVLDVLNELPEEASLEEIAQRIEFLAAIQKGIDQLDRGEGIPHEEVKRQLATWLAR